MNPDQQHWVKRSHGKYSRDGDLLTIRTAEELIEELQKEVEEQCLLNGKGAQREAALLGEVERLKRELEAANSTIEFLDKEIRMLEGDLEG